MVVLQNGEFYSLHSTVIGNGATPDGFVHGTGTSANGSFTAPDARDDAVVGTVTPVSWRAATARASRCRGR